MPSINACQAGGDVGTDSCKPLRRRMLPSFAQYAPLQPCHTSAGTVLILLRCAPANPTGAFHDTIADDWDRALTGDHVATLGSSDATDDGCVGAFLQLAAGARKAHRRHGLALRTIDAAPDGTIHAVESDQTPAGIADRYTDFDVHFLRLGDSPRHNFVGFIKSKRHMRTSSASDERAAIATAVEAHGRRSSRACQHSV